MRSKTVWALPLVLMATASCAEMGLGMPAVPEELANVLLPAEQEARLAEEMHQELDRQLAMVQDPAVVGEVRRIGSRVAAASARDRGALDVTFHVVDDASVNAFATVGGNIYVTTGLLRTVESEEELAAVLAHETAHVANRDVARALTARYGLEALAGAALGQQPGMVAQIASQVAGAGVIAAHTRGQERSADVTAVDYMIQAGYDPAALISVFDKLEALNRSEPGLVQGFFATHPTAADRKQAIAEEIRRRGVMAQLPPGARPPS